MSNPAKNNRQCPALQQAISPAECGAKRLSKIECPLDCKFNPYQPDNFAAYAKIESRLLEKASERLDDESLREGDDPWSVEWQAARRLYLDRDARRLTFFDQWAQAQWSGLQNDEIVLASHLRRAQPMVLEVHGSHDDETVTAVDLLSGSNELVKVKHYELAQQAPRFSIVIGIGVSLPGYQRLLGLPLTWPRLAADDEPASLLRALIAHLRGSTDDEGVQRWLWDHFEKLRMAMDALIAARRAQVIQQLETLGRDEDAAALREEFDSAYDASLVPASLLANEVVLPTTDEEASSLMEKLDQPVAMLGGCTARQAAADASKQAALRAWAKFQVFQSDAMRGPEDEDAAEAFLHALGLDDLIFNAPVAIESDEGEMEAEEDFENMPLDELSAQMERRAEEQLPPRLRKLPKSQTELTESEVSQRIEHYERAYPHAHQRIDLLRLDWPGIVAELELVSGLHLEAFEVLLLTCAKAASVMHWEPPQHKLPQEDQRLRLSWHITRETISMHRALGGDGMSSSALVDWIADSPQPQLSARCCAEITLEMKSAQSSDVTLSMMVLMKAVITELSYWPVWR